MQTQYEHHLVFNLVISYVSIHSLHPFQDLSLHPLTPPQSFQTPSLKFMTSSLIIIFLYTSGRRVIWNLRHLQVSII